VWQPSAVLCDTEVLERLPPAEYRSGCGEVAKYHFLGGDDLLDLPLDERVARCVEIKAAIVSADERESGRRALLNYGHTLAHALEAATFGQGDAAPRHGEAVAVGLVFAAALARRLGRIDDEAVRRHRRVVSGFDLVGALPPGSDPEALVTFMRRDKKASGDLTFVLDGPSGIEVVHGVDAADVVATLTDMAAETGGRP
ncbi:MAG: 3-dehydroquinate synthase, partial [Acidimicrobiales bacterium]|nr:3-dehydroquinate synthase [Acidimicrobiales bacterium]